MNVDPMTVEIQEISRRILCEKIVDHVIGYQQNASQTISPIFIDRPDETKRLVWNERCVYNLSVFLKKEEMKQRKIAVVMKGCDVKSLQVLVQEGQINRERITIIGVDCVGIKDREGSLLLKCTNCRDHRPQLFDFLIENTEFDVTTQNAEMVDYSPLKKIEALSREIRLQFWQEQAEQCIRCYACREVCPLCYCSECFTDQNLPQYIPSSPSMQGNFLWLLLRAYDLAGRCTGCMECDRACPVDIPLHLLNMKMGKEVLQLFNYEAGTSLHESPPLTVYNREDPDDEIW